MVGSENTGVEQIPELKHYKDSEEAGKSPLCLWGGKLADTYDEWHQYNQKCKSYT